MDMLERSLNAAAETQSIIARGLWHDVATLIIDNHREQYHHSWILQQVIVDNGHHSCWHLKLLSEIRLPFQHRSRTLPQVHMWHWWNLLHMVQAT